MRLALTHAYSWPEVRRGAERILVELGRALASRGHDVTVWTSGSAAGAARADGVTTVKLRRRCADDHEHERDFAVRLVRHLLAHGYDAVHALGPLDAVAGIRAARVRRGMRTVYTNLGLPFHWAWDDRPDRAAHERVVRDVDVYGAMSRFALDALRSEYGREGVLMPGGVDLDAFRPAPRREDRPTVLFSGALHEPRKGAATLIEAIGLVAAERPDVRLWLSGPGHPQPLLDAAPAAARDHVEVLPLGDPERQHERYGRAWVTALPSVSDSFGMVLVESLACGTPIVPSSDSALPELVDPGVTGAICQAGDAPSVAEALCTALDLAARPGTAEACRESARPYDWKTGIAPMFERYYDAATGA